MEHKIFETTIGGRTMSFEFGRYASQANAAAMVRYGDTAVLVTATAADKARDGIDFFPLSVDYEEKLYAAGKIPGSWGRREGRPGDKAILTSRLIDRPIRPLFPKGMRHDVQVVATVMSVDQDNTPEIPAMIGSSIVLSASDIPFAGPTGSVLVGRVDGALVVNPDLAQREKSDLHLVVSGTRDAVMMVEAGAQMVSEEDMLDAILFAHEQIKKIVAFIDGVVAQIGLEKRVFPIEDVGADVEAAVAAFAQDKVAWSLDTFERTERQNREDQVKQEVMAHFAEQFAGREREVADAVYYLNKETVRRRILDKGIRPDGRTTTQVRPIWCDSSVLPRVHGSGVFTRGQSQVITSLTLAGVGEQQEIDGIGTETHKRYMHHYNMPPYSTGEARPMRSAGRREIGHGALAERALEPVVPTEGDFPYTIRLVSEVVSSNGSTSMASVCGSTLALMDGGVPIKAPVAGVAMGLIKDAHSDKVAILTDIQGLEDFLGDMDFKVAGTKDGITAIQMDIKIKGIDEAILRQALKQAKDGRAFIMGKMMEELAQPRPQLSPYAPKIVTFLINPEKIGEVVGPRGKTINKIIADTGVKIDIEDDGRVYIVTPDQEASDRARAIIEGIVKEIEVGQVYTGKVVRIMPFGAFVELLPGKDGMVHISQLSNQRLERCEEAVDIGTIVTVKVTEIDEKGRVNLTRKGFIPEDEVLRKLSDLPPAPPAREGGFGGRGPRNDHGPRSDRPRFERSDRPAGDRPAPAPADRPHFDRVEREPRPDRPAGEARPFRGDRDVRPARKDD